MAISWRVRHTLVVFGFVITFAVLGGVATQLELTPNNHLGFWSAVVIGMLILGLMLDVGRGICRRWDGILIDDQNRVSLAHFQLVVWTVVVLASLGGVFFTNLLANVDPVTSLDVSVPPELWLALGLSGGTYAGASGLDGLQMGGGRFVDIDGTGFRRRGKLMARYKQSQATWGDMFASDYARDRMSVDIAKFQMFVFTVILAFAYAASVADQLIAADGPLSALPNLDTGFVTLLGLSQGGYLAAKAVKGGT